MSVRMGKPRFAAPQPRRAQDAAKPDQATSTAPRARPGRSRADVLLLEQGLAPSRAKAQALILAGQVLWQAERVDKPGTLLPANAALSVKAGQRFVSRGGEKLERALEVFADQGLSVTGKVCVDVGASTGGFTDCLLQAGATRVYAVDVGHGQLHPRLRGDARVVVRERVNARSLRATDFAEPIDLVVVDASFISLGKLVPAIVQVLRPAGELVALVKPQFEAGRREASRGHGVIRDEAVREQAVGAAREAVRQAGLEVVAETDSPIRGPKGNLERLLYARLREPLQADHPG